MLVLDTQAQEKQGRVAVRERSRDLALRSLEKEIFTNSISVAPDNGRDVSNLLVQMGRPLTSQQVQDRLKKCNANLIFERSIQDQGKIGIYLLNPEKTFVCGMESGIMPEFSVLHKTEKKVPNKELLGSTKPTRDVDWQKVETFADETRGWRTVLIRLLHARIINRSDVERYFGWTPSQQSEKWFNATR